VSNQTGALIHKFFGTATTSAWLAIHAQAHQIISQALNSVTFSHTAITFHASEYQVGIQ